jgi:transcriptional adapter 2-alpha
LRIFNTKLDEREKRRQFIIDHGLLNYRENQEKLWAMPPDERHLVQRMRLFARFQTRDEHEAFVNKILEAKRLRKEIAKLQMYRRMGITSLADIEKYEMDKVRCELHKEAWTKKEDENRKAADEAARAVRENADYVPSTNPVVIPFGKSDGPIGAEMNQSLQLWKQYTRPTKKESEKSSNNSDNETPTTTKFVIKDKPNYDLLSKKEGELCKRLRLLPQSYLDVKRALINEALAQGLWDPTTASNAQKQQQSRSVFKVDVTQRDNIIDFVLEAGWIPTRPSIIE